MKIILNNRSTEIQTEGISIQDLIQLQNFTFKILLTKLNGNLVKKDERHLFFLKENDNVEIIHMIAGG